LKSKSGLFSELESKFLSAVNAVKCFCFVFHKAQERERKRERKRERERAGHFFSEIYSTVMFAGYPSALWYAQAYSTLLGYILWQPVDLMADKRVTYASSVACPGQLNVWMKDC